MSNLQDLVDSVSSLAKRIRKLESFPALSAQTTLAYVSDPEAVPYVGAADGEAKLTDLNALRVAYENLRVSYDDLLAKLIASGLID